MTPEPRPCWCGEQPVTCESVLVDAMHAAEALLDLLDHALGDRDDGNVFLPLAETREAMQKTREYIRLAKQIGA